MTHGWLGGPGNPLRKVRILRRYHRSERKVAGRPPGRALNLVAD